MASVLLATAGYDHSIRFWDPTGGLPVKTFPVQDTQINCLQITPDKKNIAAACNPQIRLFDINSNTNQPLTSYDGHSGNVTSVGFQKDGKWMYTSSEDGSVKIWDLRAPGCQRDYGGKSAVNFVALHPNQAELVACDQSGVVRVIDLTTNTCSKELTFEGEIAVESVSISNSGTTLVAANTNGTVHVWKYISSSQFENVTKLQAHKSYILKCLLSPDCKLLATTSADHTVKLWKTEDWTLDRTLTGHQRWVWDCVFSSDSAYLVTGSSDHVARLWDVNLGETVRLFSGHHKAIICVALNDTQ